MGKPRLIILVRHAQSEGNKNREIHQTTPDHRVKLTQDGWKQAEEAGRKLRSLLRPTDTLHFFTSPYRRTRETTEGILNTLTSPSPTPSPFPRNKIKVYEEPRLREQDFGNFQPSSSEMTRMWHERHNYGHFFYRIPNGESAADAYDRISGFNDSLWRSFGEEDFASVCVLVTHGLMARVFLMKWYHYSVEYFEDLRNVEHCEFIVMKLDTNGNGNGNCTGSGRVGGGGKYVLKNELRTWSGLRREQEAKAIAEKERGQHHHHQEDGEKIKPPESPVPVRKKWGGCWGQDGSSSGDSRGEGGLMGDDFARRQARRRDTEDLFADTPVDGTAAEMTAWPQNTRGDYDEERTTPPTGSDTPDLMTPRPPPARAFSESKYDYLTAGRDGGGSRSGAASPALLSDGSDSSGSETKKGGRRTPKAMRLSTASGNQLDSRVGLAIRETVDQESAWSDALGDQSDVDEDVSRNDDVARLKRAEIMVDGSVR